MKKTMLILLMAMIPLMVMAQSSDPAIAKAKEETAVIFDLGRFFGFLNTMEEEAPELALSKEQMKEIYDILNKFLKLERIEVDDADESLLYMEEKLLTLDQLIYVDELAIAKMENRVSGSGAGGGSGSSGTGSGGGQLAGYVAGGAFNPLIDPSKTIGKDVTAFYDYLKKKLNK
ncbi:MAG: hypothetical protein KAH95_11550 [Spirochaetales bacterium]|nr:hypothetical protein [Spirochaetales bacterium]